MVPALFILYVSKDRSERLEMRRERYPSVKCFQESAGLNKRLKVFVLFSKKKRSKPSLIFKVRDVMKFSGATLVCALQVSV